MPCGDGTGPPWGAGAMTGRAAGYCAGYTVPGIVNPFPGRGRMWARARFGFGPGRWWWRAAYRYPAWPAMPDFPPFTPPFYPPATQQEEIEVLKGQAEYFEDALADVRKRIEEIEAEAKAR